MAAIRAAGSIRSHGPVGGAGSSRNFKVSCTRALLLDRRYKAVEESVHHRACLQQIGERAEVVRHGGDCAGGNRGRRVQHGQIGPIGGDQRTAAIRKDQEQAQAVASHLPHDLQAHTFEGVTLADDRYPAWKLTEMGSVSTYPSTRSTTSG
jgi:hypothetical protein